MAETTAYNPEGNPRIKEQGTMKHGYHLIFVLFAAILACSGIKRVLGLWSGRGRGFQRGRGLKFAAGATRLADETPSDREVAIAKFWAGDGGSRIGHAALHLHGGISIDVDYPIQRYFLWLKQIEHTLGAGNDQLERLGSWIASEPSGA